MAMMLTSLLAIALASCAVALSDQQAGVPTFKSVGGKLVLESPSGFSISSPDVRIQLDDGEEQYVSAQDANTIKAAFISGLRAADANVDEDNVQASPDSEGMVTLQYNGGDSLKIDPSAGGSHVVAMDFGLKVIQAQDNYAVTSNTERIDNIEDKAGQLRTEFDATADKLRMTELYLKNNASKLSQVEDLLTDAAGKLATAESTLEAVGATVLGLEASVIESTMPSLESRIGDGGSSGGGRRLLTTLMWSKAGTHSWQRPDGVSMIKVIVTGGGGGGGGHDNNDAHGGGGSGGTCIKLIDVSDVDSISFSVGKGGTGSSVAREKGTSLQIGARSTFEKCIANGGLGTRAWGAGGAGGLASGGAINLQGGWGHGGNVDNNCANSETGGNGGDSYFGGGGAGASNWGNRRPGKYGGGGAGNYYNRNNNVNLGNGGDGVVVVEHYGSTAVTAQTGSSDVTANAPGILDSVDTRVSKLLSRASRLSNVVNVSKLDAVSSAVAGQVGSKWFDKHGTFTYVVPTKGVDAIRVYVTGGGAGGGGHNGDDAQGGGGAGGTCIKTLSVTPGQKFNFEVGKGGAAATCNCASGGGKGTASKFDSCQGAGGQNVPTWGIGGSGGTAGGGEIDLTGGYGHAGNIDGRGNEERGGSGGDSYWNGGGNGGTAWGQRMGGNNGGGGGGMHRNTGGAGGGGDGVVYIEELGNGASFSVAELKQIAKVDSSHGTNVAPDGVAFGSGSVDAGCSDVKPSNGQGKEVGGIHCIKNINDGSFGNAKSWIGNKKPYKGNVFVGIRFKKPIWLKAVALSRDNTGSNNDRRAGTKQIQYTSDHNPGIDTTEWSNVGEAVKFESGPKQKIFSTTEVAVTAIRVVMSAPSDALDEIQVFGTPILSDKEQDVASGLKYVKSQIGLLQKTKVRAGASSVSGFGSIQTFFRKGNYKWTKPKGCKRIKVFVTGGGGGGGSHNTDDAHGGGGSGGTAIKMINVEKIQSAQLTVGAGGLGAVGNRQAAPTNCIGGNSVFDSKVGDPQTGLGGRQVLRWGIGAVGGIAKGGEINLVGGKGHSGNIDGCGSSEVGGNGGDSFWHGGGAGATGWANRTPGKYGGGGGGNMGNRPDSESTGRGGDGVVVVEEYY